MRQVYFALVHSVLSYAIIFWGNSTCAARVFRLQKAAVRIVDSAHYSEHCAPLFRKHGILPLPCVYILETLKFVHKNINSLTRHNDLHTYNTRHGRNLVAPYSRLKTTQLNRVDLTIYNNFNNYHKGREIETMSPSKFHRLAKNFLQEQCFYSIADFHCFTLRRSH